MGSKSQRKKERFAQRRNEKRKRQQQAQKRLEARGRQTNARGQPTWGGQSEIPLPSNARHQQRLARQIPQAWPGEACEDAAVFDDTVLSSLPPDLMTQVTAVREGLQEALAGRGDEAVKRLSVIPRGSPVSEWRLFIRGLIDWLADRPDAASEAWKRLEAERRPGRIATALMVSLRTDLEQAAPDQSLPEAAPLIDEKAGVEPAGERETTPWDRFDAAQLYHAKLLRRAWFDRPAVRVAETGLTFPEESKDLVLGPRKIQWIARFIGEYGDTEPDLTAAVAQTALARAYSQKYSDLFDDAMRLIPGPRHDRRSRLLAFFYYGRFTRDSNAAQKAARSLDEYLNRDLPQNKLLTAPVRDAIASHIHLNEAQHLMRPPGGGSMFDRLFAAPENPQVIRNHLLAAAKATPGHSAVYKAHTGWINSKLEDRRLQKAEQAKLEDELADVMQRWTKGVPEDTEPRLWLVDYLLEEERLDEARPHVDFLAASRQENPRVRATPWKWQLLEAMRLCRRKAWLKEVPARLEEAERLWPAWLPKQWSPYLSAALVLRTGQLEAFEVCRSRICEDAGRVRDSLADACLMLGAAQRMRATAAELKPLRAAVDQALQRIDSLPLEDLLETGSFFWDLHRVQLLYPAYRLQGKNIAKALFARLGKDTKLVLGRVQDVQLQKAVLWGSEYRFWSSSYETKLPAFFAPLDLQRNPAFAAAKLNAFLKQPYYWDVKKYQELGPWLRAAAESEPDAFYRHWYQDLANQLDDSAAKQAARFSGTPFGNMFGSDDDDDDDDDEFDDGLDFDPDCDCPECSAARKAYEQASSSNKPPL